MTKTLRLPAGFPKLAQAVVTHPTFCPKPYSYLAGRFVRRTPILHRIRHFTTEAVAINHDELNTMAPKQTFLLKTPKGTKDWDKTDIVIRNKVLTTAADVFRRRGAVEIDTPVFELKSILSGKYGEVGSHGAIVRVLRTNHIPRTPSSSMTLPTRAAKNAPCGTT
jgi:hypothetical protein